MNIKLHKQATTTPKIRAEIQQAPADISDLALARKYGVSDSTIQRIRDSIIFTTSRLMLRLLALTFLLLVQYLTPFESFMLRHLLGPELAMVTGH